MKYIVMHSKSTQEAIDEAIEQQDTDLLLETPSLQIGRNFLEYSMSDLEDESISTTDHPMFNSVYVEKIAKTIMEGSLPIYISTRFIQPFINTLTYETTVKLWKYLYMQVFMVRKSTPGVDVDLQRDLRDFLILSQYLKP
jgi:hypothetical protein